ncbi:hypothetical protein ACFP1C_12435 [Levilactobacillus fujinensis]|uniref:Transposase n=1 Tax=Levilactobacillus fujinensis TaxID=2486024 RepID=A0ABW1TIC5_9LACO
MTVVTTILGLKLGNVVHPSPYQPADMGWKRCEHNLKPRKHRVYKLGFLLSQQEIHPPTK